MVCRSISWFISIFVAVVVATEDSGLNSITGSDPEVTDHCLKTDNTGCDAEVTVHRLKTDNTESIAKAGNKFEEAATVDLGALLDAGDGAVVTLVAGDTRLAAHRAVLTTRSPVFKAMFNHDTPEANSGEARIPDIEGPVLRQLVAYMYTLRAPQLPSLAPQLLAAADKYSLSALKAACEQQLAAQLATENAAATAVLAVRHSCLSLTAAAITFIKANPQVMATQGWADALRNQPEDLIEVSRLVADPQAQTSTPATVESGTTTGTDCQPHSSHGRQTPATAAPPTSTHRTPPLDEAAVSRFRAVSVEEKGRRLLQAAQEGDVAELQALLSAGGDVGARDGDLNTPLHWAAALGNVDAASCLVEAGAAVDARNDKQATPLHLAALYGHVAVVELLLAASADPSARTVQEVTPLHVAALNGRVAVVQLLLAASADPNAREDRRWTPLHAAAEHGHVAVAELLLASSADPSARTEREWTPLHVAAEHGHVAVAELLLAASADPSARGELEWTPLHVAAGKGHVAVVELLLAATADPNARTDSGWTPLHFAAAHGHADVAAALLRAGADKGASTDAGETPVDMARWRNNLQLTEMLT